MSTLQTIINYVAIIWMILLFFSVIVMALAIKNAPIIEDAPEEPTYPKIVERKTGKIIPKHFGRASVPSIPASEEDTLARVATIMREG